MPSLGGREDFEADRIVLFILVQCDKGWILKVTISLAKSTPHDSFRHLSYVRLVAAVGKVLIIN